MAFIFSKTQEQALIKSIEAAEAKTSGEIRVHVEPRCEQGDPFARGIALFAELEMHQTQERNGVLFYIAYEDHRFAIVADEGINQKVPAHFWEEVRDVMQASFKAGKPLEACQKGIALAGEKLQYFFPADESRGNELSNEISR
jgi:uncharacterized membrane protein